MLKNLFSEVQDCLILLIPDVKNLEEVSLPVLALLYHHEALWYQVRIQLALMFAFL